MEFDASKVCTEWSNDLDEKKCWFSDFIDRETDGCLRDYVKNSDKYYYTDFFYGICHKREGYFPFESENGAHWKYFYPEDDVMTFDKKNLFIAGYRLYLKINMTMLLKRL
jgi:hypothetical protein